VLAITTLSPDSIALEAEVVQMQTRSAKGDPGFLTTAPPSTYRAMRLSPFATTSQPISGARCSRPLEHRESDLAVKIGG
jgi:hypothetical protein